MRYSRRTLLGGALGGLLALGTGAYAREQYVRRNDLRFDPLVARNDSQEAVEVVITAGRNLDDGYEQTVELEAAGEDGDEMSIAGPWIKHARAYAIRAETGDDVLVLENEEIVDRLAGSGWGPDTAAVTVVVTPDGELESEISPVE
ncbi:hypothetical protein OB905_04405 [Halobacteria archaeon AArc-dxtr1]|nr:hypothetical protein [Halobacteria archaeon AArc-dxtr1]